MHRAFAPVRSFRGGLFLPTIGRAIDRSPVLAYPAPAILNVPLTSAGRPESSPVIAVGERVQAGQLIGRADKAGALNVHSPVAGRIRAWARVDTAGRTDVRAVAVETVADEQMAKPFDAFPRMAAVPDNCTPSSLEEIIAAARESGLTDFQPGARGLADELERAGQKTPDHLVINTLPGEPLASQGLPDLQPNLLVRVAEWLGAALPAQHVWIALDRSDARTSRRVRAAVRGTCIRVGALLNKYPQHAPVLLASSIAGREVPPGSHTLDVGVFVLQAEALVHLATALAWPGHQPAPMTHRVVTVSGPAVLRPGRYWVPIGTSFGDLLCQVGLRDTPKRVIEGGPLTGRAVAHLEMVTTKETSALLVLDASADRVPAPGPCVRCGWCQEDCPVGLDPQMLMNLAEQEDGTRAAAFFPEACIECGVCSYVCPAGLPLATAAVRLKQVNRESQLRETHRES